MTDCRGTCPRPYGSKLLKVLSNLYLCITFQTITRLLVITINAPSTNNIEWNWGIKGS